jgi:hypothetical protein
MGCRYFQVIGQWIALLAILIFIPRANGAQVVTRIVGSVGSYFLTSREVIAGRIIERRLYPSDLVEATHNLESPLFDRQLTTALLEKVVALEAESFSIANVEELEVLEVVQKLQKELKTDKQWESLQVTNAELKEWVERKLRSKKFLKYKTDSATLGVTDSEVKEYFEKNRYKFGNMSIENFRENIRVFLVKQQMEDRLKEWFEILKKKYRVRNFFAEGRKQ